MHKYYIYSLKYIHVTKDWKLQEKFCIWLSEFFLYRSLLAAEFVSEKQFVTSA